MYGPLNVKKHGDYWEKLADKWDRTVENAKKSKVVTALHLISHQGWKNV